MSNIEYHVMLIMYTKDRTIVTKYNSFFDSISAGIYCRRLHERYGKDHDVSYDTFIKEVKLT